eukprot:gene11252-4071_t
MFKWHTNSELDGNLRDFKTPSIFDDPTLKTGVSFIFQNDKYIKEQAYLQSIFPNKKNQLSNYRGIIMLSFSHQIKNIDKKGKVFLYVNIRYKDGSILPIFVLAENINNHEEFETECIGVPNFGQIENVLIGIGACDLDENESNPEIKLSNVHFDISNSKISFDKLKKRYSNKCTRTRLLKRTPEKWKTDINKFQASVEFTRSDLTIVSQLTIDRLKFLKKNVQNHRGPYSVSIYLKKPKDIYRVERYWANNELIRKYCTIHIVYAHEIKEPDNHMFGRLSFTYPINYLRNLAKKYSKTDFIMYIDIDFVLTNDLYEQTKNGKLIEIYRNIDPTFRSVIILPCFVMSHKKEIPPKNRAELLQMIEEKKIETFPYDSQKINRYDLWLSKNSSIPDLIEVGEYFSWSEPYFIFPRYFPLFSERFIGCGRDKLQLTMAIHHLNFRFFVWRKQLMTHPAFDEFKNQTKMEELSDSYPPASLGFHSFVSHYFMMWEELSKNKTDIENEKKESILMNHEKARIIWLQNFQKYVEKNFPKIDRFLPQQKKMLFHEELFMTNAKFIVVIILSVILVALSDKVVSWKNERTRGASPLEREHHTCELIKDSFYIFGGRSSLTSWTNSIHSFKFGDSSWKQIKPEGNVPGVDGHTMASLGSKIWITGGRTGVFSSNSDTSVFDTDSDTFKTVQTKGEGPPAGLFSSCSIGRDNSFIVFGGTVKENNKYVEKNDVYSLNTVTLVWSKVKTTGDAPVIQGHKCVTFGNKMYVFGGIGANKVFSTNVYFLDLEKNAWSTVTRDMKPRAFSSASVIDQRAYLFGGVNSQYVLEDLLVFNLVTHSWEQPKIQGNTIPRQGHCSVGHDGKVYIFGGKSNYQKFLNDVVVLDTKPGSRKEEEKDLSAKIQADIIKFNILLQSKTVPVKIQSELKELLASDAKEEELLKGIQAQLKAWDEVETMYTLMTSAKANVHKISSGFDYDIKAIETLTGSVEQRRKALNELSTLLQSSINDLKTKEELSKVATQKKMNIKDTLDQAQALLRSLKNEISSGNTKRQQLIHEDSRLKQRLSLLDSRKKEIQKTAEYSQANAKDFQTKEKELNEELTKLRERLSKIDQEKEKLEKKFEEQNNSLAEVVRQLDKFKEMTKAGESLKDVYKDVVKAQETYKAQKKNFATLFQVGDVNSDSEQKQKDDELSYLDRLLNKKDELLKNKAALAAALETAKGELVEHSNLSSNLKGEEAKIKKALDDVSSNLAQVTGESSAKSAEKEKVDHEWTSVYAAIEKTKDDLSDLVTRSKSLGGKVSKASLEEEKVRKEFEEAQRNEADALKNLQSTQRQMEAQYVQFHEQLTQFQQESEDVETKGHELEASKLSFTTQRKDVDTNKQKLMKKIKEIDDERNAQMNKMVSDLKLEVESRDKKVKELEQQILDMKKAQEEAKMKAEQEQAAKKKAEEEAKKSAETKKN